jgi:hypothetical protein
MKKGVRTIETTFGNITIFNNHDELKSTQLSESSSRSRDRTTGGAEPNTPPQKSDTNQNEDFLGFDLNDKKNSPNYFDQNIIDEYKMNRETEAANSSTKPATSSNNVSVREAFGDEMNSVDELYFKTSQVENQNETASSNKSVTAKDLESLSDMNFIDQLVIKPLEEQRALVAKSSGRQRQPDDDSIGSVRGFKEPTAKARAAKEPMAEIPIIKSRNLTENDANEKNFQLKKQKEKNDKISQITSQHKLLQSEVPDWTRVTVDEAAAILNTHVCYFNEERMNILHK